MALAEESASAELSRLRAVLDAASDAYVCGDASARVVDCNRAAEKLLGVSRQQLLGAIMPELMAPEECLEQYHAIYQQLLAGVVPPNPLELTLVRADGSELILAASVWVTEPAGGLLVHGLYRDVTDRVRLQQELVDHARGLNEAQALARLGSWEWEVATGALVWSAELYRVFGIDQDTPVTYATFADHLHPEDRGWVEAEVDAAALHATPLHYDARIVRPDGQVRWITAHGTATTDADGVPTRVGGTAHDITDRKLAELELERLAVTDALTGLGNRVLSDTHLEAALDDCRSTAEPLALLLLDLDGFKPVNDLHGHPVGDVVLVEIAERLTACIRPGDTLARVGGDEFALVLPGADRSDAVAIAQRLVDAASAPVTIDDTTTITVGASVGIAVCEIPTTGVGELRRQADRAMYTAKRSGRGCHVTFTPELTPTGTGSLSVRPRDARAWAAYMVALRDEVGRGSDGGTLPESTRPPASVLRTRELLLAAIEHLPEQREDAQLPLPEPTQLEEFIFYHDLVQVWADTFVDQGVLTTRRSPRATAFWTRLRDASER